jgi:hypothetical protein
MYKWRQYFKRSSVRLLRYLHSTAFTWEKASSKRWVVPKNTVKRRPIDRTEAAKKFSQKPKSGRDRLFGRPCCKECEQGLGNLGISPAEFCGGGAESRTVVSLNIKVSVRIPSAQPTDTALQQEGWTQLRQC